MSKLVEIFNEDARKYDCLQTGKDPFSIFPVDCLHPEGQAYVQNLYQAEQIPIDFSAPLILFATATSCFRNVFVNIVPNRLTPINLYGLFVAPSGFGKTSIFRRIFKPFYDKNNELYQSFISSDAPIAPKGPKIIIVEDITSERLANVWVENCERICYLSSDGRKVVDVILGCYKDKSTDEALLLKGFSGDPCSIERNNGQHICLNNPLINITIAVQPDKAMQLFSHKSLKDSGLLARFLCVNGQMEPRLLPECPAYINTAIEAKVHDRWKVLLNKDLVRQPPVIIHADKDVYLLYRDYYNSVQQRLRANETIATFMERWPEITIRIAGVLHMYEFSAEEPLSADTLQKAIKIQETFFVQQQIRFLDGVNKKNWDGVLAKTYSLLEKNNGKVSIRDAYRNVGMPSDDFIQLVKQNPNLRLEGRNICYDNRDSD